MKQSSNWDSLLRLTLALSLVFSTPCALFADEGVTITPPQYDSYLRQDQANTNFGTATTMHVQSRNGSRNRRAVVQFNLTTSGVPATAAVKVTNLSMTMSVSPSNTRNHNAHVLLGPPVWTGTTVTWNNRTTGTPWTTPGGDFNAGVAATQATGTTANVRLTWRMVGDGTIPNIGQQWLSSPATNFGLIIKDQTENTPGAGNIAQYVTQNGAPAASRPALELRYLRDVTLGVAAPSISSVTWTWAFPVGSTAANYDGVLFAKKAGTGAPFTFVPADGTSYSVGTSLGGGEDVVINTSAFTTLTAVDENGADSVVLPGTAYTYKSFNHDNNNITGATSVTPPHYAFGVSGIATTTTGGGLLKNWSYLTAAASLSPPSLIPGKFVLAGSNDAKLHTMSTANGGRAYRPAGAIGTTGGAIQSRPVVIPAAFSSTGGDVAYVGSADGSVYAFDPNTGTQLWQSAVLGNTIAGSPAVQLKMFSNGSFPHAFDLVIVATRNTGLGSDTNNAIHALDGNTGAIVWSFIPGNLDIISSTPMLHYASNSIWVTSRAGLAGNQPSLWKLDTSTTNPGGNLLNSVTLSALAPGNRHIDSSPSFNFRNNYAYCVTTAGDLVVVDHVTPSNVYSTNVGAFSGMSFPTVLQGAVVNEDDVYFTTSGGVHKRSFDRVTHAFTNRWDAPNATLGGAASAPAFVPAPLTPALFVGVADGRLKKLDTATGLVTLTRDVNLGTTIGDPSLDLSSLKIYVGDSSGRIYSFDIF
jgi:outer membrane protein assembly factor BamB